MLLCRMHFVLYYICIYNNTVGYQLIGTTARLQSKTGQVVTCFRWDRFKFGCLNDVAIGGNGEIIIVDNGNHKFDLLRVIGQGDFNNKLVRPMPLV